MVCRHHIFETLLEPAVSVSSLSSIGPDIIKFKTLKTKFVEINKIIYHTATDAPNIAEKISDDEGNT